MINVKTAGILLARLNDTSNGQFTIAINDSSSVVEAYMKPVDGLVSVTKRDGLSESNLSGMINSMLRMVDGNSADEYFIYGNVSPTNEVEVHVTKRMSADEASRVASDVLYCEIDHSIVHTS